MVSFLGLHAGTTSRLAGVIGFTYAFQTAFAAYAVPNQTEKYYDLAGSLGFISSTILSFYSPSIRSLFLAGPRIPFTFTHHFRQALISAMYIVWAGRLGSFLLQRIQKHGKDGRFDEIKKNPILFSFAWFGQATWITCVSLPALLINTLPRAAHPALGLRDLIAVGIWAGGLGLEIVADRQKSAWRKAKDEKKHQEKFITSGVWSLSRHPNYLGEILLQCGPPLLALPSLPSTAVRSLVCISPVFTYFLLRYASGVPPLEQSAEKKWGSDKEWRKYADETSVLVPWPAGLGTGKA
ncbi:MAG: hypothetical protein TREMPRED_000272 [Tremellales sp. Tagirdzhanova-0007]|nr:MAG: hypothetical protein TREMPRED_000272 [Tremellales sp. Tagirdzhanova-0007]